MTQRILLWWCSLHLVELQLAIVDDHIGPHSLAYWCDYFINVSLLQQVVYLMRVEAMSLFPHHCSTCLT